MTKRKPRPARRPKPVSKPANPEPRSDASRAVAVVAGDQHTFTEMAELLRQLETKKPIRGKLLGCFGEEAQDLVRAFEASTLSNKPVMQNGELAEGVHYWRSAKELGFSDEDAASYVESSLRTIKFLEFMQCARPEPAGSPAAATAQDQGKPAWDAAHGTLRFGVVSCAIPTKARRLRKVLDAFQAAEWRKLVDSPFREPNDHHQSIYSLNGRLKGLRFVSSMNGTMIGWSDQV